MFKFINPTSAGESIYNLSEPAVENHLENVKSDESESKPRYRSIHSGMVRREVAENHASSCKTLGVPHVHVEGPKLFLKKHSRQLFSLRPNSVTSKHLVNKVSQAGESDDKNDSLDPWSSALGEKDNVEPKTSCKTKPRARICTTSNKPPVPPANLGVEIIIQDSKDFVKLNATEIISKIPKSKILQFVDTPRGHQQEWHNFTGLNPQNMHRLGHLPRYIYKRKKELLSQQQALLKETDTEESTVRKLEKDEIDKIVAGLTVTWNQVFKLYQSLPLQIDTPGKIKRKTGLEAQLKKLEDDLQTLQRHDSIYVSDVAPHSYYAAKRQE